jgi:hypothetical protein
MKTVFDEYTEMTSLVPEEIKWEVATEMAISNRIEN